MLKEILKANGLEDTQIDNIVKAMGEAKVYTTKLENIDERYSKLKGQKTDLETQLNNANGTIEDLKKNNKDNETLQATIKQHESTIETLKSESEAKISKMEFDYALEKELNGAKSKNNKALKALLDLEGIKYQEGKFEGLESQLENLKKEASYLFEDVQAGQGGFNPSGSNNTITKEQFGKMNYSERMNLFNTNKALYDQLNN